jgi:hypothetical protein
MGGSLAPAVVPFVVGVLLSVVAYSRGSALAQASSHESALKAAA